MPVQKKSKNATVKVSNVHSSFKNKNLQNRIRPEVMAHPLEIDKVDSDTMSVDDGSDSFHEMIKGRKHKIDESDLEEEDEFNSKDDYTSDSISEEDIAEEDSKNVQQDSEDMSSGEDSQEESEDEYDINADIEASVNPSKLKPLTVEELKKYNAKIDQTGVVYLSHIPPFMRPIKLRQLLAQYGEIGRIYLVPEDAKIAARRKKYKGNKRPNFVEGWVEFLDKRKARSISEMLNAQSIGGKKRSHFYDDIWNIKYLPRFKWHHLTEQVAYERAVREQKLKTEMSQASKENKEFLKNVEKSQLKERIAKRKASKMESDDRESKIPSIEKKPSEMSRFDSGNFPQRKGPQAKSKYDRKTLGEKGQLSKTKLSVLSKIFK